MTNEKQGHTETDFPLVLIFSKDAVAASHKITQVHESLWYETVYHSCSLLPTKLKEQLSYQIIKSPCTWPMIMMCLVLVCWYLKLCFTCCYGFCLYILQHAYKLTFEAAGIDVWIRGTIKWRVIWNLVWSIGWHAYVFVYKHWHIRRCKSCCRTVNKL